MWSLKSTEQAALVALAAVLLCACSSTPQRAEPASAAAPASAAVSPSAHPAAPSAGGPAPGASSGAAASVPGAPAAPPAPVPARATADFGRAVGMMRTGKTTEAELEFQEIA